jgi:hypothetical protein
VRNERRDKELTFMQGVLPAGAQMLWVAYDDPHIAGLVRCDDVDGELGGKSFPGADHVHLVAGAEEPRLALVKRAWGEAAAMDDHELLFHDGRAGYLGRADLHFDPSHVVAHPGGAGYVVVGSEFLDTGRRKLVLAELGPRFEVLASRVLEADTVWVPMPDVALSRDARMVFVRFELPDTGAVLDALRVEAPGQPLVPCYRARVPARTMLVHDTSSRRAFAFVTGPAGLEVAELGPEPPRLRESGPHHVLANPFAQINWCTFVVGEGMPVIDRWISYRLLDPGPRREAIAAFEADKADDWRALETHFYALLSGVWLDPATELHRRLQVRYADYVGPDAIVVERRLVLMGFALSVTRRDWRGLGEALSALDPSIFAGHELCHYHHLVAVARAAVGDLDEARRHVALARAVPTAMAGVPGPCASRVDILQKALDALGTPPAPDDLATDAPAERQIVAVLHAADERLARGDAAGAVAVLERPLVWDVAEAQSLARLAAAYLDLPAATPADRFRKALALATFVGCMKERDRSEMLAPGLLWGEDRLRALTQAAIAWLESDQGVPRGPSWLST